MNEDIIKNKIDKYFDEIELPAGLQERISSNIYRLAGERKTKIKKFIRITLSTAAIIALIIIPTFLNTDKENIPDTTLSVEEAYIETHNALQYLSYALSKGYTATNKINEPIKKTKETINKHIL
ncbi:MAG: hypothetical protein R3Y22_08675 [Bacteroidales bacterium]